MLDVFNSDEFSVIEMTEAIEAMPVVPGRLGRLNLFSDKPVASATIALDEKQGRLSLVPAQPRGSTGVASPRRTRSMRALRAPHLPVFDSIVPEDVAGVRAFGTEDELESAMTIMNERLADMKQDLEATHEYQRAGAIQGVVLDADGATPLYNLFTEFNITETVVNVAFGADSIKLKTMELQRALRDNLGALPFSKIHVFCGSEFYDALITHPEVAAAYERWQDGLFLRQGMGQESGGVNAFEFAGVVWEEFRYSVGSVDFMDPTVARAIPLGASNLFRRYLAPADYMETVNTLGKATYAKQEPRPFNKGIDLEVQSNPLYVCSRPGALIKLDGTDL